MELRTDLDNPLETLDVRAVVDRLQLTVKGRQLENRQPIVLTYAPTGIDVKGDIYNGRVVRIANSFVFKEHGPKNSR